MTDKPPIKLKLVEIPICQPCLDGIGEMCTTPGCALWLHKVDLPIDSLLYETKEEFEVWP